LSPADGECSRDKFIAALRAHLGEPVGYKAGLTNPAVQKRFHHDSPVRGTLFASMLLPSGATVPARFGARPVFEADLLVRVSDSAINRATTPAEVLQSIDQVIPFIELPDLMVAEPGNLDGAAIIAINVGARLGIMGNPIPVQQDRAFADAIRNMRVIVTGNGAQIDSGLGSDVLDHPLNAVTWLVSDLARDGLALKAGDLVSLGSFSRLLQPSSGLTVDVQYLGLPGDPRVGVMFR
jgi:2-keto-4-pentenoate hydratase